MNKSFETRRGAEKFAETKQPDTRNGKADPPSTISFEDCVAEHGKIMCSQVTPATLRDQMRALRMFMEHVGKNMSLKSVPPKDAESLIAARLASRIKVATANKDIRTSRRVFNLAIEPRGYITY